MVRSATGGTRRRRLIIAAAAAAASVLVLGGAAWAVASGLGGSVPNGGPDPHPRPTSASTSAKAPEPTPEPTTTPPPAPAPEPAPAPTPQWNIDDPNSLQVVVNKQRPLSPASFVPSDLAYPELPNANGQPLRLEAALALERMYAEARAAGVPFAMVSGFRSFELQQQLFANYSAASGVAAAETFSARPGHSEHQTGLAVDISECPGCALSEAFGQTAAGLWVRENAHRFGFLLRYDQGLQPIVGYVYEPWHFRYVGVELATDMRARGIPTLEQYFGLPAAPTY